MTNIEARKILNLYVEKIVALRKAQNDLRSCTVGRFEIGETIKFGFIQEKQMEWIVIRKEKGKVQLLSNDIIYKNLYNDEKKAVVWENSTLYQWLNTTFYGFFSEEEKAKLVKTNCTNNISITSAGYIDLLSVEEANRLSIDVLKCSGWWWLSSPGHFQDCKANVTSYGRIDTAGRRVDSVGGVRPVIYLIYKEI